MSTNTVVDAALVRELFDYDPETGWLIRKVRKGMGMVGTRAGSIRAQGYRCLSIGNRNYVEHRIIWLHVYGEWPSQEIDHIDGDKQNNRISNLRDVSPTINQQNRRRAQIGSKSGLMGVKRVRSNDDRYWVARIRARGKRIDLGQFKSPEAAYARYVEAKRQLHEGNTL